MLANTHQWVVMNHDEISYRWYSKNEFWGAGSPDVHARMAQTCSYTSDMQLFMRSKPIPQERQC